MLAQQLLLAFVAAASTPAVGAACGAFDAMAEGTKVDLAPPAGYVDACSRDKALCDLLTRGYPPSVRTLAYFVPEKEWAANRDKPRGFTRYLIAQVSRTTSAAQFDDLKDYIRSQQGSVPDYTNAPEMFQAGGRTPLGVFDETADSIAFGIIMKSKSTLSPAQDVTQVSINAAMRLAGKVFSLYVFGDYTTAADVDATEQSARAWLSCLRKANAGSVNARS